MATQYDNFINNMKSFNNHQKLDCYRSLKTVSPKSDLVLAKIKFLEEEYPVTVGTSSQLLERDTPYHVAVAYKLTQLYRSSVKRDKEFDLELNDVHHLLEQKVCFYTGKEFEKEGQYKRTIDRVDHNKGYVKGNVVACTDIANQLKARLFEEPTREIDDNIEFMYSVASKVLSVIRGE